MKPAFALSLSFDGIALLHRAAGGWRSVGEVALDADDLRGALAGLRERAQRLAPGEIRSKVIIPNDQVRYLSVETGRFSGPAQQEMVRAALARATPYPLEALAWDTSPEGETTHVAAVVRETLAEAEAFAAEHGFGPVSFVAIPGDNAFLGEPFFGAAAGAAEFGVEPDGVAVVVIGEAVIPESRATSTPMPSFSSRRIRHLAPAYAVEPEPEQAEGPRITLVAEAAQDTVAETEQAALESATGPATEPLDEPETAEAAAEDVETAATASAEIAAEAAVAETVEEAPVSDEAIADSTPAEARTAALPEPEHAAVTAPAIVIPDEPDDVPVEGFSAFLSRRSRPARPDMGAMRPRPQVGPATTSAPSLPTPRPIVAPLPPRQMPKDEAGRMTVFGARNSEPVQVQGRRTGLMVAGGLLAVLATVAVSAQLLLPDGLAGLSPFGGTERTEIAVRPAEVPSAPAPAVLVEEPAVPAPPEETVASLPPQDETAPESPSAPELSPTDAAVLDALREPSPGAATDETATIEPDGAPEPDTALLETAPPADDEAAADGETPLADPAAPVSGAARYAATGIWPNAPEEPETPAIIGIDDLYIASIDRTDLAQDAIALAPLAELDTDRPPAIVTSPTAAGTEFKLDATGLVEPSRNGTLNPEGVLVYLGSPPLRPPPRPVQAAVARPEQSAEQARLASVRPRIRPAGLAEQTERSELGGLTRAELAGVRPKARPASLTFAVAEPPKPEDPAPAAPIVGNGSALAVATSPRPDARPKGFASLIARATPPTRQPEANAEADADGEPESTAVVAAATTSPRIPSSASVARQATLENAINLRQLNLIGVYGTPSNRRALIRLPSGRYKKVQVGDTVDGGRVVAIGDGELRYQKGGRNMTLKVPSG